MAGITPFTVINDLKKLLDDKGIKNEVVRKAEPLDRCFFNQIKIPTTKNEECFISAVCHTGSYGYYQCLIEVYNFNDEPVGWLSPEEALKLIIEYLHRNNLYLEAKT